MSMKSEKGENSSWWNNYIMITYKALKNSTWKLIKFWINSIS